MVAGEISPRWYALAAAAARESTSSLRSTRLTWVVAVWGLMKSDAAISRSERPWAS